MNIRIFISAIILFISGFLLVFGAELRDIKIIIFWYTINISIFVLALVFFIYNIILEIRIIDLEIEDNLYINRENPVPSAPPAPILY